MATKYVAPFTYSDQELLDLYRAAVAEIAATGQRYQCADGRQWDAANLPYLTAEIRRLECKIAALDSSGPCEVVTRMVTHG